jgi:polyphosphate glucokinase
VSDREAFLRRFHAARPGITSSALAGAASYDRLIAAVPRGARVLDLACGDAHLVSRLGPRAIGLDLTPSPGPHGGAAIVCGRAQAMPFADGAFDACVCHLAFMLFDDLERVVAELRRVVVPGGVFAAVLGGGPTADDRGDDAFHRFLAIAAPRGPALGDRQAGSEAGWRALFGDAPVFERLELDRSGPFDDVWRFLGASYQLAERDAPAVRARLRAGYAGRAIVPCRAVVWLAVTRLGYPRGSHRGVMSEPTVTAAATAPAGLRTLAIDIGGTGLKALVLDAEGHALTDRVRVETPRPATPAALVPAIVKLVEPLGAFDRISIGFPGVVVDGVTLTAPNLHKQWRGFELARVISERLGRPVRALNDAGVQGYGVIEGRGVEMVVTLGTGMGCAIYLDGNYVPNLELAHHPFNGEDTYEDYVSARAMRRIGKKKWNRRVAKMIAQILPVWNPRHLYLGGGNAKHLTIELPANVTITPNIAGLTGGIVLWHDHASGPGDEALGSLPSRRAQR